MPTWAPTPDALVRRFEIAVKNIPEAEIRKMFGYPAGFLRGNMFTGLFQEDMILRMSPEDRADAGKQGAKSFEPMPGRPMKEYIVVPPRVLDSPGELKKWLAKSVSFARTLPPKARKPAKQKKKA
jgi:TfoX/Sxy family transcriptional regulator of competence genes